MCNKGVAQDLRNDSPHNTTDERESLLSLTLADVSQANHLCSYTTTILIHIPKIVGSGIYDCWDIILL
jgi:hypothetical protein